MRTASLCVVQVNCRGYNAFGRRKREIARDDKPDEDALDATQKGQLREEITIESNAILTFERREERLMDPTEGKLLLLLTSPPSDAFLRGQCRFLKHVFRQMSDFCRGGGSCPILKRFCPPNRPFGALGKQSDKHNDSFIFQYSQHRYISSRPTYFRSLFFFFLNFFFSVSIAPIRFYF